jgi:hypothetical protein
LISDLSVRGDQCQRNKHRPNDAANHTAHCRHRPGLDSCGVGALRTRRGKKRAARERCSLTGVTEGRSCMNRFRCDAKPDCRHRTSLRPRYTLALHTPLNTPLLPRTDAHTRRAQSPHTLERGAQ